MICVSVIERNETEFIQQIKKANETADCIELRLDALKNPKLEKLLKFCKKPVLVTARSKREGGIKKLTKKQQIELIKQALKLKCEYVDIELGLGKIAKSLIKQKGRSKVILSTHSNRELKVTELKRLYRKMKKLKPDYIKIVPSCKNLSEITKILLFLSKTRDKNLVCFGRGEKGIPTRILARILGQPFAFAVTKKTIGKLTTKELAKFNQKTKIFAVVGNPIEHSLSPLIHNYFFQKMKINAYYFPLETDNPKTVTKIARKLKFSGLSVTMPLKEKIRKEIDQLHPACEKIGSVNTIVKKRENLKGYNTDFTGAINALETKTSLNKKNVLVFGAGGTAKAIIYGLKNKNANIFLYNRTHKNAILLRKKFGVKILKKSEINKAIINSDIIVNTTPIGMKNFSNNLPFNLRGVSKKVVMDTVYTPLKTRFLKKAEKNGNKIVSGIKMFAFQAQEQFKLFTEKKFTIKRAEKLLVKHLGS